LEPVDSGSKPEHMDLDLVNSATSLNYLLFWSLAIIVMC